MKLLKRGVSMLPPCGVLDEVLLYSRQFNSWGDIDCNEDAIGAFVVAAKPDEPLEKCV